MVSEQPKNISLQIAEESSESDNDTDPCTNIKPTHKKTANSSTEESVNWFFFLLKKGKGKFYIYLYISAIIYI